MPTSAELQELCDNCTWTWTILNGKNVHKVTGQNGNHIFIPAAGTLYYHTLRFAESNGYCWSNSLDINNPSCAYVLMLDINGAESDTYSRESGMSVRAVCE